MSGMSGMSEMSGMEKTRHPVKLRHSNKETFKLLEERSTELEKCSKKLTEAYDELHEAENRLFYWNPERMDESSTLKADKKKLLSFDFLKYLLCIFIIFCLSPGKESF